MSKSEPRAENRENRDHQHDLDPIWNRQGQVMPVELTEEFPQKRQNTDPRVWHQRAGLDTAGADPSQGGSRQAGPGSWKTWTRTHDRGSGMTRYTQTQVQT